MQIEKLKFSKMTGGLACAIVMMVFYSAGQASGSGGDSTVVRTPNANYTTSGISRFFWGDHYRDVWATPIKVRALNLKTFAGGLHPLRVGGGKQTTALIFSGADGRQYAFRSIDKDPSAILTPEWRTTIAHDVLQDQISSQHPLAALIAHPIEEAAGVLHVKPQVFVLPDDPALNEFRKEFAGLLGMMVELPGDHTQDNAIFAGAAEVIDGQVIFDRIQASPKDRVDSKAFLAARLIDILIGDWDRHRYQWRWARFNGTNWLPIAEDRDQAFSRLDGLFPAQARFYIPQFVGFEERYPNIYGLHHNAREVDSRFLADLEKSAYDSIAASVTAKLTDTIIEEAVAQIPPEMVAKDGVALTTALKRRRDNLPNAAAKFYDLLANTVTIQATDADEIVQITEADGGHLDVLIAEQAENAQPYFRRRFDPAETREIRIHTHAGDDRVLIKGEKELDITVRLIGGKGDDEFDYSTPTKGVRCYDQHGANRIAGNPPRSASINTRPYPEWVFSEEDRGQPRDWGHWTTPHGRAGLSSDYGFFIGAGATRLNYGFRKQPYAQKFKVFGGISTEAKYDLKLNADFRGENTPWYITFLTHATQVGLINYFGEGNDSEKLSDEDFYRVQRTDIAFEPALARLLGRHAVGSIGGAIQYSSTADNADKFISTIPDLYGAGNFGQVEIFLDFQIDSRDIAIAATKGSSLNLRASYFPKVLDLESSYGLLDAVGTTYLTAPIVLQPTLALRGGGRKIWGDVPYFESAFIGGIRSLRGFNAERFAGDASLYGSAELRLFLTHLQALLPGDIGIFGFTDVGRVYVDGDSPGGWHSSYGGGLSYAFLGRQNMVSAALANSSEGTRFHLTFGFAY